MAEENNKGFEVGDFVGGRAGSWQAEVYAVPDLPGGRMKILELNGDVNEIDSSDVVLLDSIKAGEYQRQTLLYSEERERKAGERKQIEASERRRSR